MAFTWTPQSISWFLEASRYTAFHQRLAQLLLPHLRPADTLCDAGCGLGRLDLLLAPHIADLLAVDIDIKVLDILRADAAAAQINNLRLHHGDAAMLGGCFDVLLMSFFGRCGDAMDAFYRQCRRLIRIVNAENMGELYPEDHRQTRKDTLISVRDELEQQQRAYTLHTVALEFGQPLRSRAEAQLFIRHHAPHADAAEIDAFLSERAVATGRADFPFYLPNNKELGIFIINGDAE